MSTFAQQTTRSRHTSSSSIQPATPLDGPPITTTTTADRSYGTQPRTGQSRERSISSYSSTTTASSSNKSNTPTITSANSSTIDGSKFVFLYLTTSSSSNHHQQIISDYFYVSKIQLIVYEVFYPSKLNKIWS
jgi:hypothetical protein